MCKYDEKGNMTCSDKKEYWHDYDENGNRIHLKRSNGQELWNDYDEKGNMIHEKEYDGNEE